MKQLLDDPWQGIEAKYPVGTRFKGRVTNITDYGAFVELEPGIEGLIHVSEMSWTKKNVHPGKIVSTSQEVEVQVLEVDPVKRRISLGLKQTMRNPWEVFVEKYPAGSVVEGEVKNKTEFGLFLGLDGDVDGMVHLSDLDWKRPGEQVIEEYKKGDKVQAQVLDVDVDKERISLGIKQLAEGGAAAAAAASEAGGELKKGAVVTCEVMDVKEGGLDVRISGTDYSTFIKRAELARDRSEQRPDRFAVGQKVDARVIQFDRRTHKVTVSIKALEVAEEKEAIAQYGSSDSGATLGDILGTALKRKGEEADKEDDKEDTTEE
jgi:small subunit ribosomal protein S1